MKFGRTSTASLAVTLMFSLVAGGALAGEPQFALATSSTISSVTTSAYSGGGSPQAELATRVDATLALAEMTGRDRLSCEQEEPYSATCRLQENCHFTIPTGCRLVVESIVGSAVVQTNVQPMVAVTAIPASGIAPESNAPFWTFYVPMTRVGQDDRLSFWGWTERTYLQVDGNPDAPYHLHIHQTNVTNNLGPTTTVSGYLVPIE